MSEPAREHYLAELEATLPLPPDRRREVLEEIAGHLEDAVAERVAAGFPAELAETAAQGRLGSPRQLARELARPEQTTWRLFAAAGSGLRAGVGSWIYGYLLGALLVYLAVFALAATIQLGGQVLTTGWSFQTSDGGWNSVLTASAVGVGLYFGGRSAADAASMASRRLRDEVRPWVAFTGTALAWGILTLAIDLPQNWASVAALSIAPAAVALGVYRPGLIARKTRLSVRVIVGLLIAVPLVGLLTVTGGSSGGVEELPAGPADRGLSIVGPMWPGEAAIVESSGWGSTADGAIRTEWSLVDKVALDGLTDLRVEAWRTDSETFAFDTYYDEPFATAPVVRQDSVLQSQIVTTRTPGIDMWELVLTGIGRDGERYVLSAGSGGNSTFNGSVWDWLAAVFGAG
jgi:uncharacterized membrane protein